MAALGPTAFAVIVWANILLVFLVFGYEAYALLGEQGSIFD